MGNERWLNICISIIIIYRWQVIITLTYKDKV